MSGSWMIYGAYGYTGKGTAELAVTRGHKPILAGRTADKLTPVAESLGLPHREVSLTDRDGLQAALSDVDLVLHTAGPFSSTAEPMVEACLATGTHYLDVTGEIDVFETVLARGEDARAAGVVLMPGVGMDVVPSDCLAAMLSERMPEATHLEIALSGLPAKSAGTAKTVVEGLYKPGKARIDGAIVEVPTNWRRKKVPFHDKPRVTAAIPWGDVSTAYHSTGIPNITTYMGLPRSELIGLRIVPWFRWLLRRPSVQRWLKKQASERARPPTAEQRAKNRTHFWARVFNGDGDEVTGAMTVPGGYGFTFDSSIRIAERVLAGEVEAGAWTPSKALGARFVTECDDVTFHGLS